MKNSVENRTMPVVLKELNESVDKYNLATDAIERANLAAKHKELAAEYNELSMLDAYATCMAEERPLVALAKMYEYSTISVKDTVHNEVVEGVKKSTVTRSVNEGSKKFNVTKFIEWTEERNKTVAYAKDWKSKTFAARNSIVAEWKKFFASNKDSHSMSIGKTKKALQAMFDALVFIEGDKGNNAIIANGDIAKFVLAFANDSKGFKDEEKNIVINGNVLPEKIWNPMLLNILYMAVAGKTYEVLYGEPEEEAQTETKAEAEAEAK